MARFKPGIYEYQGRITRVYQDESDRFVITEINPAPLFAEWCELPQPLTEVLYRQLKPIKVLQRVVLAHTVSKRMLAQQKDPDGWLTVRLIRAGFNLHRPYKVVEEEFLFRYTQITIR